MVETGTPEGHEQMTAFAGQLINVGLMGNTISDLIRMIELDGEDDHFRPKTIAFITLHSISLVCQILLLIFAIWRFLFLRNRNANARNDDSDGCGNGPCNCCKDTGEALFAICFTLTVVISTLQVTSAFVGAVGPVPRE